jgi:hypothetical protein
MLCGCVLLLLSIGRKERGLAPDEVCSGAGASNHLTSTISKFGVGATQAGFYLAHTITVRITKEGHRHGNREGWQGGRA